MLRLDWNCCTCGKPLPKEELRADAYFCPPVQSSRGKRRESPCRAAWYAERRRIERDLPMLRELADVLTGQKDPERGGSRGLRRFVAWYRAAIQIEDQILIYPAADRPTRRFDGVERQSSGFRVYPFEPPVVPMTGEYDLSFYDYEGRLLQPPPGNWLWELRPVLPIRVDSGEVLSSLRVR